MCCYQNIVEFITPTFSQKGTFRQNRSHQNERILVFMQVIYTSIWNFGPRSYRGGNLAGGSAEGKCRSENASWLAVNELVNKSLAQVLKTARSRGIGSPYDCLDDS